MEDHVTPEGDEELRSEMSTADINDLPDSDFAYIEPGGKKDDEGKTVPRSLRHFPIHDAAHVRNALARAPQSPFGDKAMPKILKAAKKFGIDAQQNSDGGDIVLREEGETTVTTLTHTAAGDALTPITARRSRKPRHRAVPLMPELRHRSVEGLEIREAKNTNEIVLRGTPILYNTPYEVRDMFGTFVETMSPGVATECLARGADIRFLFNHDGLPLARTTSGTMTVSDGDEGLHFEARLDARQQLANDLWVAVERGDVSQLSVGFVVAADTWDADMENRTIHRFDEFMDISCVTYPASPQTSVQVAKRMAMEIPVESRARIRKAVVDVRAGKVLSASNQDKILNAVGTLHDVLSGAGVDLSQLDSDDADAPEADTPVEPDVNVSPDGTTGGSDAPESGVGADGFPVDQTRSAEPGEPIREFHRSKVAVDQAWLDSLIEDAEDVHGDARKRIA